MWPVYTVEGWCFNFVPTAHFYLAALLAAQKVLSNPRCRVISVHIEEAKGKDRR